MIWADRLGLVVAVLMAALTLLLWGSVEMAMGLGGIFGGGVWLVGRALDAMLTGRLRVARS